MNEKNGYSEHILACLSSSPSNAKIIKTASQMATALGARFTALYVKTPASDKQGKDNAKRLDNHIHLAQRLGAEIVTVYGEDIAEQIAEFSRLSGVTKVVLGRSNTSSGYLFPKKSLTDRLIRTAPWVDIHIIPDAEAEKSRRGRMSNGRTLPRAIDILITALMLALFTALGFLFHSLKFTGANTVTVYILGALLTALFTKNYICSVAFSFAGVLLFNFFFTEPRLSLMAYESGYPVTFAVMLIASLITGTLANRLAKMARLSANAAYRTGILLEANRLLQKSTDENEVIDTLARQIRKLVSRNVVVYPVADGLGDGKVFSEDGNKKALVSPQEKAVAKWAFENRCIAGAGTDKFTVALCLYLPIKTDKQLFCIIGIQIGAKSLEPFENSILSSLTGEGALAIENLRNAKEKEQNALIAKNEQLRANLLRSISHDLRTPLTSISGNTENLLANFEQIDEESRRRLLEDVYDDSQWLISVVENLLSVTRISEGRLELNMSPQLADEVISESLKHISRKACSHRIEAHFGEGLLLAQMDARLISQVIINLIDNAVKYTPYGSEIIISAVNEEGMVKISVADNGGGIAEESKTKVFQMFYTEETAVSDCRRSLGLGLALCKSIVAAHNGELWLEDNTPHGCIFTFTLKASEVKLNEQA